MLPFFCRVTLFILAVSCSVAWAGLSPNVIVGGNFESTSAIKILDSPRTQAEINGGLTPVRSWQFHPGGVAAENAGGYTVGQEFSDLGKWIGAWAISTNDDPRALYNQTGNNGAPNNVSLVSRDGQNTHVMEGVRFRSWVAQVVQAPANHVAGTATIDFDYYFNQWEPDPVGEADSIFHVWIGGLNTLPTYADRAGPIFGGYVDGSDSGTGGKWSLNPLWDSPNFNSFASGGSAIGFDKPMTGSQGQVWHKFSDMYPSQVTFNISTPYPYYYVSVWQTVYSEPHPYYWMYASKPSDQMAVAIDNISLQLPINSVLLGDVNKDGHVKTNDAAALVSAIVAYMTSPGPGTFVPEADCNQDGILSMADLPAFNAIVTNSPDILKGDVNIDGLVNALDISPFVSRLTSGEFQAEADINRDVLVNALDISGFVTCLVNGACAGEAGGTVVPEPATLGLLVISMGALRRRGGVA